MPYFCLPYLYRHPALQQLHNYPYFGSVLPQDRGNRQIRKIRISVNDTLISLIIDRLEKIPLAIKQADADQWQAQVAGCLAVIARQNAKSSRVNRETFMKTEFKTEIGDPVARVQACINAIPQCFRMIIVISGYYAVVISQENLIFGCLEQQGFIHTLEESLRVMSHGAPQARIKA